MGRRERDTNREHGADRERSHAGKSPRDLQDAAVLVPVFRGAEGSLRLVIVRRTDHGVHGGQLAFPGGKPDARDHSMRDTAIREAQEEIGVNRADIEILADLPLVETRTTGFRIHPFLAKIRRPAHWKNEEREIAEVLEVRVAELADPAARGESIGEFPNEPKSRRIHFYRVGPHRLWGASYRIVTPLIPRLLSEEWDI
jgi:8-oxo-dGTP pyrophosphatase MutT (NUDIX family)